MNKCKMFWIIILYFVNFMMMMIGLVIVAAAIYLNGGAFEGEVEKLLPDADTFFKSANCSANNPARTSAKLDFSELTRLLHFGVTIMIVVGVSITILGIFGTVGACWGNRVCLIIYIILVLIALVAFAAALDIFYNRIPEKAVADSALTAIHEQFKGLCSYDFVSVATNYYMAKHECCGIENYKDFDNAENWDRMYVTGNETIELAAPVVCCHAIDMFPSGKTIDVDCLKNANVDNSNVQNGCESSISSQMSIIRQIATIVCGILILLQVACIGLACYVMQRAIPEVLVINNRVRGSILDTAHIFNNKSGVSSMQGKDGHVQKVGKKSIYIPGIYDKDRGDL